MVRQSHEANDFCKIIATDSCRSEIAVGPYSLDMPVGSRQEPFKLAEFLTMDYTDDLPLDFRERFLALFQSDIAEEITIYPGKSLRIFESRGKTCVRIYAKDLFAMKYGGKRFVYDLYMYKMLDHARYFFGNDNIQPFTGALQHLAIVGNGLMRPGHEFPKHEDWPGTYSAYLPVSDMSGNGSDVLRIAFRGGMAGAEDIMSGSGMATVPFAGHAKFFRGDGITHGGGTISEGSPPRLALAMSWHDPDVYFAEGNQRDVEFTHNRQSGRLPKPVRVPLGDSVRL